MSQLLQQIEELAQPLLDELGFELVDLEYRRERPGWVLRLYLDKEGGITLDDCSTVSREMSTLLDVEDLIDTAYHLEVSSPGIERPLKKLSDFQRFSGSPVKIKTSVQLDPDDRGHERKTFSGTIVGVAEQEVVVDLDGEGAHRVRFPFVRIEQANLQGEF